MNYHSYQMLDLREGINCLYPTALGCFDPRNDQPRIIGPGHHPQDWVLA